MTTPFDFDGEGEILSVDKPYGWSSFDVVRKVRNLFHIRKIGHAGTLDPLATGLLVLCTGPKTKDLQGFLEYDKEYSGTFRLGIVSPSYDTETEPTEVRDFSDVTSESVRTALESFVGTYEQLPPMYSALKHKGRALYKYAREGASVPRTPRVVTISECTVLKIELPDVTFRMSCSKGTYVRSFVHDVGSKVGCGAVLTALRRERIGPWLIGDAWTIDGLTAIRDGRPEHNLNTHGVFSRT